MTATGYQALTAIPLIPREGTRKQAVRNGNNTAWLCCNCHQQILLGAGNFGVREKPIQCPGCGAVYRVKFADNRPDEVKQVQEGM